MTFHVLITGVNRGLGFGLLKRHLMIENRVVIGSIRTENEDVIRHLQGLPKASNTRLVLVQIDSKTHADAFKAVEQIKKQGVDHLDLVIANAGISYVWPRVADAKIEDMLDHLFTNTLGIVSLYQATRLLMREAKSEPIFVVIGSSAGRIRDQPPIPNAAYGPSKAASSWLSIRINAEDEWLHSFTVDPGWAPTDLGTAGAEGLGLDQAAKDQYMNGVDEACDGMMSVFADTSKAKHGGMCVKYTGEILPW